MVLRQTFAKEAKTLSKKAGGYAHAKQNKRLLRTIKRQRTLVGKLIREVRGKLATGALDANASSITLASMSTLLERADRIRTQQRKDKNKLYALHAPEVECISKGKVRSRYEFGVKLSLAITHKQGLIARGQALCAQSVDGHPLAAQITQCDALTRSTGRTVKQAFVDLGYRGVDADNPGVHRVHRGRIKSMNKLLRAQLKRRQAIEPTTWHVKHDHRLIRCHLKGSTCEALPPSPARLDTTSAG